jgi:CheY-like chemotaxis protein/two-component sensor histidine kinase
VRRQVEEFQRTERRMNEFLAMLAHELRNPLAPMRTALDIVERSPDDAKLARFARDVFSRQLGHMTRLVDDLLDVSRITSGKIELRFEAVDLNDVLRDAVDGMRPLFDGQRQSLDVALPSSPTPIRADPTRLLQAATNLLSNAHKYTPPGGRIAVTLRRDGEFAELEVRDNGHGIEASLLPRIFDLFVQGDRHVDRKEGGLGIGLTLVKRLVELHGGTISATSPGAGQGSVFTVRLPMHDPPAATDAHAGRGSAEVSALKVLVVEDVADVANSMAMLLRVLGHTVRTASDGASALERARTFAPDLVLLDIGLPGISGYEVAQALRLMPATRDAMLVACTGYGRAADRERAVEAGFDRHVVKPVGADELMAILSDAAARRSSE